MRKSISKICIILTLAILATMTACGSPAKTALPPEESTMIGPVESMTVLPAATPQPKPTPETIDAAYLGILESYYSATHDDWDAQRLMQSGLSICTMYSRVGDSYADNVGYRVLDINGDGTNELMIGAIDGDDFVKHMMFDLYTLVGGVPVIVCQSQERDRYYFGGEGVFYNEGSWGAGQSVFVKYRLGVEAGLQADEMLLIDESVGSDSPWYYCPSGMVTVTDATTNISQAQGEALIIVYQEAYSTPELTPISALHG